MARTALFLNPGADLAPALALARRADALGYESLWVTHGAGRDALLTLSAYAHVAPHPALGSFTPAQWLRFIDIHTHHHFKIIRDIKKG